MKLSRVIWILGLFGCVGSASAHQPSTASDFVFEVEKPEISYALVGSFDTGDEIYTVQLSYDEPFALPFELLTEHREKYAEFRPVYAVIGPGLPEPSEADHAFLPRDVPDGSGVFIDRNDREREVVFESVMRRAYYSSGAIALPLLAESYEVWIWSPDGEVGDFTLGFGVEEDFSDGFGGLFSDWSDYAY